MLYTPGETNNSWSISHHRNVARYIMHSGYVQGMNELLSPLMIVFQSEHQSFWCLVNVLQRMVCHCFAILSHYFVNPYVTSYIILCT